MTDKRDDRAARFAAEHKALFERLASVDLVALERRVLDAIGNGGDPHAEAYAGTFDVLVSEVNPEQRRLGKAINYGLLYAFRHVNAPDRAAILELLNRGLKLVGRLPSVATK